MNASTHSIPWNYDFARIIGPKASGAANFQDLVGQLLAAEMSAEAIDGAGGDLGVDSYIGRLGGHLTVFQVKYFLGRLRSSQRAQIKRSLDTALRHHDVAAWILCTPGDPTPTEREWLSALGPPTEWWGETKLRSLLARYPGIASQFFTEPALSARLAGLEEEVSRLRADLLPRIDASTARAAVLSYIKRAEQDCAAAFDDARALQSGTDLPWITIDFSELCGYLSADPSLSVHRPLVDFCLDHSPSPVILPPGTVYEMGIFVRRSTFRLEPDDFLDRLRRAPEARLFVEEFAADPGSAAAVMAYRDFVARMRAFGIKDEREISRLRTSLQTGTIRPAPGEYRNLQIENFNQALRYFQFLRPVKDGANYADAANIEFLLASQHHLKTPSRMISSARSMMAAAGELCAGRAVVRTPRQFALSLNGGPAAEHANRLNEALARIRGLRSPTEGTSREPIGETNIPEWLQDFANTYRDLLRPIDDMIEDGFRVISRIPLPRACYLLLRDDAEEVATFRRFWERVTQDHHTINDILCKKHGYDEVADQIESSEGG